MSTAAAIAGATRALSSTVREPVAALGDEQLCDRAAEIEQLGRLVDSLRVEVAGELDSRARFESMQQLARRHALAGGVQLLEFITRVSQREAARRVQVGRGITPSVSTTGELLAPAFPLVGEALSRGDMGVDAAAAIIRHLSDAARTASIAQLREAETHLVDAAHSTSADLVAVQARAIAIELDPDGVEPREEAQRRRRRFVLGREGDDGMTAFHGLADPLNAALLRSALGSRTAPNRQPRFVDPDDPAVTTQAEDGRGRAQRAFDIVFGLLTAGIRTDNGAVGTLHGTATVSVVVTARDLVAGTGAAWIDDILSPVATSTTREIICDGGLRLQIQGDKGEILWEGHRQRYFTPAQRRALAVRDGGCLGPQCTAPPSWCHAHHVIPWQEGGPTDVENGAMLCPFHHHQLHAGAFQLRMNRGIPEILAPPWLDREQRWRPTTRSRLARAA